MAEPKPSADTAGARDGIRRAFDIRLGPSWLVRWDTIADDRPRVLHVPAPAGEATACRTRSGDLVVFDGYLFDRSSHDTDPAVSNAALVASAYGRRPDGLVQRLAGAFAVIIWDEARRRPRGRPRPHGSHPVLLLVEWPHLAGGHVTRRDHRAAGGRGHVPSGRDRGVPAEPDLLASGSRDVLPGCPPAASRPRAASHARGPRGVAVLGSGAAGVRLGEPGGDRALRSPAGAGGAPLSVRGRRQHRAQRRLRLRERGDAGRGAAARAGAAPCRVPAISGNRVRRGPGPGRGGARPRNAAAPPDPRRDARRSVHRGRRASPVFREPQPRPQPVAVRLHRAVSLRRLDSASDAC